MDWLCTSILIPVGGLFAVLLVGWKWGISSALLSLKEGIKENALHKKGLLSCYLKIGIKYTAPLLILIILIHMLSSIA